MRMHRNLHSNFYNIYIEQLQNYKCFILFKWPSEWLLKLFFHFHNKYFRNIAPNPCKVLNIYVMVFCTFLLIVQETPAAKRPPPLGQTTCFPWCRHCSRVSSVPEHLTPLISTASADESPCQYHVSCCKRGSRKHIIHYTTSRLWCKAWYPCVTVKKFKNRAWL